MKKIIGYFKNLEIVCYARNSEGKLREIHPGDQVFAGEIVVDMNGNLVPDALRAVREKDSISENKEGENPQSTTSTDSHETNNSEEITIETQLTDETVFTQNSGISRESFDIETNINAPVREYDISSIEQERIVSYSGAGAPAAPAAPTRDTDGSDDQYDSGDDGIAGEVTIDMTAPVVTVDAIDITNDATPELTGTVDDPNAVVIVTVNEVEYVAINNGNGTWVLPDDEVAILPEGMETISVKAIDFAGNEGSGSGTILLDTTAPVLDDQHFAYTENQGIDSVVASITASDNNVIESYTFATTGTQISEDGYFAIDDNGNITITEEGTLSAANDFELDPNSGEYEVMVNDIAGNHSTVTITLSETNVNDNAPVAIDDVINATEDTVFTSSIDLIANDTDLDSDHLSVTAGTFITAQGGTLVLAADGSYTYTPLVNFNGTDTFAYTVTDGTFTDIGTLSIEVAAVNDAPVLSVFDLSATEDGVSVTGNASFTDVDTADTHSYTVSAMNAGEGFVSIDAATGLYTYTVGTDFQSLAAGATQNVSFDVTVTDNNGLSDTSTVTVTINGSNDAAIVSSENITLTETDTALSTGGTLTATDVDNADNAFISQSNVTGTNGTFNLAADGSWTYVANAAFDSLNVGDNVSETFTVKSVDGTTSTVTVTINGTNDAAIVSSENITLTETDTALSTGGTLTATDVDNADNAFISQSNVTGTNGTFNLVADGSWTYVANAAFDSLNVGDNVSETFTVKSVDGTTSTVTVTINGTNDAAIVSSENITLTETDTALSTGGTLTATDVDNADNAFISQSNVTGTNGTFNLVADGSWTYVANAAFDSLNVGDNVSETFTVKSVDGTTSTVTVTINGTNDAAIVSSENITLTETDTALSTGGTLTATDVDNADNAFIAQSNVTGTNGTFSIATDGTWTYVANAAFDSLNVGDNVSETFTVKSVDGTTSTVTVTINGTNDAPIAVADGETSIAVNTSTTNGALVYDSRGANPELLGGTTSVDISMTLKGETGSNSLLSYASPSSNNDFLLFTNDAGTSLGVYIDGANKYLNLGGSIYDGNEHTLEVSWDSASGTLEVKVDGAVTDTNTLKQGYTIGTDGVLMLGQEQDNTGGGLDSNQIFKGEYSNVSISTNGTEVAHWEMDDIANDLVEDSVGNFDLDVRGDVSVLQHDPLFTTDEDTTLTLTPSTLLANDIDIDGGTLIITSVQEALYGTVLIDGSGNVLFTPDANYHGSAQFSYTISDGHGGTDTQKVYLNVDPVNDSPVALDDSYVNNVDAIAVNTSTTNGALVYDSRGANPELLGGATSVDISMTLKGETGSNSLLSYASPSSNNDFLLFTNDAGTSLGVYIDGANKYLNLGGSIYDGNEHTLEVSWDSASGTLEVKVDGAVTDTNTLKQGYTIGTDGVLMLGQEQDNTGGGLDSNQIFKGEYSNVSISTNGTEVAHWEMDDIANDLVEDSVGNFDLSTTGDVLVVTHSNPLMTDEDSPLTIQSSTLLSNDSDPDGDTLSISSVSNATNGTVSLNVLSGEITFIPESDYYGEATFDYTVSDGNGGSNTATVTLQVNSINDAPLAINDTIETNEDTPLTFNANTLLVNDYDVDGDNISITAVSNLANIAHGTVILNADDTITYTPDANYHGTAEFNYSISDGNGGTASATVSLIVNPVVDQEDVDFGGSWTPNAEPDAGWSTDNSGGKLEVGYENTYLHNGSQNKIVEIDRYSSDEANLYTDIDLTEDQAFVVEFDLAARVNNSSDVNVYWTKVTPGEDNTTLNDADKGQVTLLEPIKSEGWEHYRFVLPAKEAGTYRFEIDEPDSDTDSVGALIDNITTKTVMFDVQTAAVIDGSVDGLYTQSDSGIEGYVEGNAELTVLAMESGLIHYDKLENISTIDLSVNEGFDLGILSLGDVVDMTDTTNLLTIEGNNDNDKVALHTADGWIQGADNGSYTSYTNSSDPTVLVQVDDDITVAVV